MAQRYELISTYSVQKFKLVYKKNKKIGGKLSILFIFSLSLRREIKNIDSIRMEIKFFPLVQLAGCMLFGMLGLMLLIARTFQTKHFKIYNQARWMMIISQFLLVIHFILQFVTQWRLTDPPKGIMLNMIFFPISGLLMILALLHLLRAGKISKKEYFVAIWGYLILFILLVYGYFVPKWLYVIECINSVGYFTLLFIYGIKTYRQYKVINEKFDNFYGEDTTLFSDWAPALYVCLCSFCLCVPFAILGSNWFLKGITVFTFLGIFYYVNRFIYYGYDIHTLLNRVIDNDEEKWLSENNVSMEKLEQKDTCKMTKAALEKWEKKHLFTTPSITIEDVVKQTNLRHSQIVNYLNSCRKCSFRSWLSYLRIEEAKKIMLEHPEYSHETIADMAGFSSRTYFLKVFKDKEGKTPGEWLEENQKV